MNPQPAERPGLQHEHPHAGPPGGLLRRDAGPGPEGRGAAGDAGLPARRGLPAHGHQGEPLVAHGGRRQQEEGTVRLAECDPSVWERPGRR